jgi:hypothetical protein
MSDTFGHAQLVSYALVRVEGKGTLKSLLMQEFTHKGACLA